MLSSVIHGLFFVIAGWVISDMSEPSISTTLLKVSIRPSQANDDNSAETASGHQTASPESAAAAIERVADVTSVHPTKTADVTESPLTDDRNPFPLIAEIAIPGSGQQAVAELGQADVKDVVASVTKEASVPQFEVVTTSSESQTSQTTGTTQFHRPVITQTALSSKQEKMLTRKFEEWTENFYKMPDADAGLTWKYKGQEYLAKFTHLMAEDDMGIPQVVVEVSTEEDGKRLSTEMRMKRLAFSSYAQFVNRWDPNVQIHNDELNGRFHSNTEINLSYNRKTKPRFHGEVTTSARGVNFVDSRGYAGRNEIFLGGLQTRVKAIRWPKEFLPLQAKAALADHQVRRFDEDARVTFYADGSYAWKAIGSESPRQEAVISASTTYLIAAENVTLHVKGTVNGKVLVYSPQRIVIEDDLVYARDPAETLDAGDYLGLVSDKYVDIAPPDVTGPGKLIINAAIYAKRRFVVREHRSRNNDLLYIYGSLTAGSLSATEPRYYTRIQFDERLDERRPPGFPMTNRYVVDFWDSTWKVEPHDVSY